VLQPEKIEAFFELFALRCGQLERLLGSRPYFGGDAASFADFTFWNHYDLALTVRPTAGTQALNAWAARVRALPAVAAELAERPPAGPSA
jgi:glutathione S-transferase